MDQVIKSIERYKRTAMIELVQEISQDYSLNLEELYQKYIQSEFRRCSARKRDSNQRCTMESIPGTNFCKRHQYLCAPRNEHREEEGRSCIFKHDHPPFEKNVPGCKKCEYDQQHELDSRQEQQSSLE